MLGDAIPLLRCPHCGGDLTLDGRVVHCERGHGFDVARHGYVNLLPGDAQAGTADTAAMMQARDGFLEAGHYAPIAAAVASACERAAGAGGEGCLIDLGAGTGHYLATALDRVPERLGLALDISKHALRDAARAHERIGAVGCDVWEPLPVRDRVAAAVLSVFSPRNPGEIARVLTPTGTLVVAAPTQEHLRELIPALELLKVDERKRQRLDEKLRSRFAPTSEEAVEYELSLSHADLAQLVAMGPSARHADAATTSERISALPEPFTVTASVTVVSYRLS